MLYCAYTVYLFFAKAKTYTQSSFPAQEDQEGNGEFFNMINFIYRQLLQRLFYESNGI